MPYEPENDLEEDWAVLRRSYGGRGRYKDLSGFRFNRLVVREKVGADRHGSALWRCECDCGGEKVVARRELRNNAIQSCGCLQVESRYKKR
jgi:hypothetical protein